MTPEDQDRIAAEQDQYEPAALAGIEPVAWLNKKLPHMAILTKPDEGGGWFPVYSAATDERLVQERDQYMIKHEVACDTINRMQQERNERHKNCVNAADYVAASVEEANTFNQHHEEMLQIIADKEQQLAAMTQERDELVAIIKEKKK